MRELRAAEPLSGRYVQGARVGATKCAIGRDPRHQNGVPELSVGREDRNAIRCRDVQIASDVDRHAVRAVRVNERPILGQGAISGDVETQTTACAESDT
jgi:hypothetical protein